MERRFVLLLLAMMVGFTGCTSAEVTTPDRSAFEQLLLSTAIDNALMDVVLAEVQGRKVYVDGRYLESYDEGYLLGSIRALLSRNGALLQNSRFEADVVVEARSGALGVDQSESLVGIPSLPIILPLVGGFETPDIALYASEKEDAVAKIALLAYERDGAHLFSRDNLIGKSHLHQYKILLLLNINFTDVPAREGY